MASNVPLTGLQGQIPIRRKGNTKCSAHRNKDVILHCTDCSILVCLSCSISTHSGHTLTEISDIALQRKDVLQDFIHDIENNKLIQLQNEMQSIENKIHENDTNFKDLGQQVKKQGEVCKKQIDVLTDEFVSICDNLERDNRDLLLKYKDELQQRYKSLLEQVRECKEILQTGTDILVYDSVSDLSAVYIPEVPVLHEGDFHPCTLITDQLRKALGMLNTSSGPLNTSSEKIQSKAIAEGSTLQVQFLDEPAVLTKFKSPMDCTSVCPTASGAWLYDNESNVLLLVDAKGVIKQRIQYPGSNIMDISISQAGNLWFCCRNNFSINEVAASSFVPITRFEADTWPTSICITKEGNVVVGTRHVKDPEGKLSIYTTEGHLMRSTFAYKKGSVFGTPFSISECSVTGSFAVTSWEKKNEDGTWSSNVRVYDQELKFRFDMGKYGEEREIEMSSRCPWGAAYDSKGHLLVGFNNMVKLMSGNGQYLRTIIKDDGSFTVVTFGVQPDDVLWVHFYANKLEKRRTFGKLLRKRSDSTACKSEIKTTKYYKD
ncbi:uncharacterized protein LOC110453229 [Mizuhopecten yessoensis]|uniref:uncharacterized protein LOC110453229 n=1 Tax=Mizuhopecten yessoensis TaxID=6573 RepID=UPI000B45ADDE|nr:uncharacterized protein LOC110453229 [Mizuhopecten yessoensis]